VAEGVLSGGFGTKKRAVIMNIIDGLLRLRPPAKDPCQGLVADCDGNLAVHVLDMKRNDKK